MIMKEITSSLEAARQYWADGMYPIPLGPGGKKPIYQEWTTAFLQEEDLANHFSKDSNVGIVLGAISGVVDVDLDAPEAIAAAPHLLPNTLRKHGRAGKPISHYWYRVEEPGGTKRFHALDQSVLCEYRADGAQTMVPPSVHPSGEVLEWSDDGEPLVITAGDLREAVSSVAAAALFARHWPNQGSRHQCALALAGVLVRAGWSVPRAESFIHAVCVAAGTREDRDDLPERTATVVYTMNRQNAGEPFTGAPRLMELVGEQVVQRACQWLTISVGAPAKEDASTPPEPFAASDVGNAKRLVQHFGTDVCFVHNAGEWRVWDGRRWAIGSELLVERRAKEIAPLLQHEANTCVDPSRRSALEKSAGRAGSAAGISAMIRLSRSEVEISATRSQFDRDERLLNVENGTLDLRTGVLHPYRREQYITRLAPVQFDASARSEDWEQFLHDVTGGDDELRRFLQQIAGYVLVGGNCEQKLFLIFGPGATGKSSFIAALSAMLGDYALTASFDSFLRGRTGGGINNDIARLDGPRLVTSSEVNAGRRIDEGTVKQLTGGDKITARFLYGEHFEFLPKFTPVWVANHPPLTDSEDDAIWRRLVLVPFTVQVPLDRRDPALREKLCECPATRAAIFAWAVEGCLQLQREGKLVAPQVVKQATEEYRLSLDGLSDFLVECCEVGGDGAMAPRTELYNHYVAYARELGSAFLSNQKFFRRIEARGFQPKKAHGGIRFVCGLRLVS
jgi:putative DNA primase/helicase